LQSQTHTILTGVFPLIWRLKFILSNALFFITLVSISGEAAENVTVVKATPAADQLPHLSRSNVSVGGSLGLGYSSLGGVLLSLNPSFEYFIANGFSVGGTARGTLSKGLSVLGFGPSMTFFPFRGERSAVYLGASVLYSVVNQRDSVSAPNYWVGRAKTGYLYFFTPAVALGPELAYSQVLSNASNIDASDALLMIQFSLFL
jgi:hypothetical protein